MEGQTQVTTTMDNGMEDLTLITEEVFMVEAMEDPIQVTTMDRVMEASMMVTTTTTKGDNGMEDLTLITEAASIMEVMEGPIQVTTTMDRAMEASMMVTTTTKDQTPATTTMDSGTVDSMVVALPEGKMGGLMLETIIMDNGMPRRVMDIILDMDMAMNMIRRRREGQPLVS